MQDFCLAQGYNHQWLIGRRTNLDTITTSTKARLLFDIGNMTVIPESRKMAFYETQANISDENGNLIAATNGCWIMDATGDSMQNGSGLSPGSFANSWCTNTSGIPFSNAALIIPFPGDSNKFILFHQVGDYNNPVAGLPTRLYYTIIDKSLNSGLGAVIINQKNLIAFQDTISVGFAACKHANGRDWWVLALKDTSKIIYKVLVTTAGISSVTTQIVNMPTPFFANAGQPCFSPDGTKFAYTSGRINPNYEDVRIFSFDRCTGQLDSIGYILKPGYAGFGLSFSSNSRYLFYSSFGQVFQLDTDAPDIATSDSLIANWDGFAYPFSTNYTNFWLMYRAANGKIYISSQGGTIHFHVINNPDSAGIACDLQQHSLQLPCYGGYGNVNHPNYYLGCDTTCGPCLNTGLAEQAGHDFKFSISPNPNNGTFKIIYMLPQNRSGMFEVYDVTGKKVFSYTLPPWSTLQHFDLGMLSDGVYSCVITSNDYRVIKKVALIKD